MKNILVAKYENSEFAGSLYVQEVNNVTYRVLEVKTYNVIGSSPVRSIVKEDYNITSYPTFEEAKAMAIRHAYALCPGAKYDNLPVKVVLMQNDEG